MCCRILIFMWERATPAIVLVECSFKISSWNCGSLRIPNGLAAVGIRNGLYLADIHSGRPTVTPPIGPAPEKAGFRVVEAELRCADHRFRRSVALL